MVRRGDFRRRKFDNGSDINFPGCRSFIKMTLTQLPVNYGMTIISKEMRMRSLYEGKYIIVICYANVLRNFVRPLLGNNTISYKEN